MRFASSLRRPFQSRVFLKRTIDMTESVRLAGVLAYRCGPLFAALTGGTLAAYTAFTFSFTQVLYLNLPL